MQIDILSPYKLISTTKIPFNFIRIKKNVKKDKHKMHHVGNISLLAKEKEMLVTAILKKKIYIYIYISPVHNLFEVATYF